MKIALIKETKTPVDNRVALSPKQVAELNKRFPQHQIVVQASDIRAYSDDEYRAEGVQVCYNVSDADVLFGIKEAKIDSLIPDKHYFFFGHIAKKQEYNRPLLQAFMQKHITFCDYEYLVDDNNIRVCAFGWWAGVVGVYYTLRGYGLKHHLYELPKPDRRFTLDQLLANLKKVQLPKVKLLVTGAGRVSQGAQYVLDNNNDYKNNNIGFAVDFCPCDRFRCCIIRNGERIQLITAIRGNDQFDRCTRFGGIYSVINSDSAACDAVGDCYVSLFCCLQII